MAQPQCWKREFKNVAALRSRRRLPIGLLVSHPQEPTGEEWWADVLDDLRARTGRDAQED